jgi:2-methylisocitrate lyase-like PEP mutase family enzyme
MNAPEWLTSERTRAYLYRVLLAAVPLLILSGAIDASSAALWVALGASVLGLGTATVNTSTKRQPPEDEAG